MLYNRRNEQKKQSLVAVAITKGDFTMTIERMKHGSCAECGAGASEGASVFKITYGRDNHAVTSICLCETCMKHTADYILAAFTNGAQHNGAEYQNTLIGDSL